MKRYGAGRKTWFHALACLLLAATAWAQKAPQKTPGPQIIRDFRVPEFDENGVKKSEVVGEEAEILEEGRVKITGLRIVLFREGQVEATILADQCTFDRKEKLAFSNSEVSIERGGMKVTGRGFRYAVDGQRIEILNDSRVVLKDISVWKEAVGRRGYDR